MRRGARLVVRCPHLSKSYPLTLFTTEFCRCLYPANRLELRYVSFRKCLDSRVRARIFFLSIRECVSTSLGHVCLYLFVVAPLSQTLPRVESSFGVCQGDGKWSGRLVLHRPRPRYSARVLDLWGRKGNVGWDCLSLLNALYLTHLWVTPAFTGSTSPAFTGFTYLDFFFWLTRLALTYLYVSSAQQICCWFFYEANQIAVLHLLFYSILPEIL